MALSDSVFIKANGFYFIILHIIVALSLIGTNTVRLLSPITLIYLYTAISLAIGSWGFASGYILLEMDELIFQSWEHTNLSMAILILNLSIFVIIGERFLPKNTYSTTIKNIPFLQIIPALMILLPFFFIELNLDVLSGGGGSFSNIPQLLFSLVIILYVQKYKKLRRYIFYILIIGLLAVVSIEDKREAIFLILPMLFLESLRYPTKLNFKNGIILFLLLTYCTILILAMSIARGYGGYGEFTSIFNTIGLIPSYISTDFFISAFLLNIEAGYFYFHGINSIELVLNNIDNLSLGSTFIKPLFLLVPRYLFPWKPDSIITLYTMQYDASFRAAGGSFPINIFSEFFWNFHLMGIFMNIFLVLFGYLLYKHLITSVKKSHITHILIYLVCYFHIITLVRGSGIDLYAIYILLSIFFVMFLSIFFRSRKQLLDNNSS
tara:strand:- start:6019 stop:7326 length:1308 start_codon:yes stop_codon:yes gene_type:complete